MFVARSVINERDCGLRLINTKRKFPFPEMEFDHHHHLLGSTDISAPMGTEGSLSPRSQRLERTDADEKMFGGPDKQDPPPLKNVGALTQFRDEWDEELSRDRSRL